VSSKREKLTPPFFWSRFMTNQRTILVVIPNTSASFGDNHGTEQRKENQAQGFLIRTGLPGLYIAMGGGKKF
jgi:hypothetical protein